MKHLLWIELKGDDGFYAVREYETLDSAMDAAKQVTELLGLNCRAEIEAE